MTVETDFVAPNRNAAPKDRRVLPDLFAGQLRSRASSRALSTK